MLNTVFYALLMLLAGLGIPVMAALNSGLGIRLQSPAIAASLLFFVGLAASLLYLFVVEGIPKTFPFIKMPWYFYCGGILIAFYVLSITPSLSCNQCTKVMAS